MENKAKKNKDKPSTGAGGPPKGTDTTDAKGFIGKLSKLACGTVGQMKLVDIEDDDIETVSEAYTRAPTPVTLMTKKEMLADVYKMDFPRRGKALVINNKNFSPELTERGLGSRTGTDIDATRIGRRLEMLGFEVDRYQDVSSDRMRKLFAELAAEDHSDADCFACVLLSHGEKDNIYGTDDTVELKEIFEFFKGNNCKSLAGKPKLFFIQACRGHQFDEGVAMNVIDAKRDINSNSPDRTCESQKEIRIPNEADFLIAFSTVPGYYSWRNSNTGSWFIQSLVIVLDELGTKMELLKILTRVNKCVAYKFKSNTLPKEPGMHMMKQIPSFTSMLTKDLYFIPKKFFIEKK